MKTFTTLLSGALLTSALLMGCSMDMHSSHSTSVTDPNGNTTITETSYDNGKTSTKTYNSFKKDTSFDNETGITFKKLEMKSSDSDEYKDVLEGSELESGYKYHYKEYNFNEKVTSVDFKAVDQNGEEVYFKGVDVSNIKNLDSVNFVFSTNGSSVFVNVQ